MQKHRFTDCEIFFSAVLGLACVLLTLAALVAFLNPTGAEIVAGQEVGDAVARSPLIARAAPSQTLRHLYVFFVLLPASLAFLGIGVPFALRTLLGAARGKATRRELWGLAALAVCIAVAALEPMMGTGGIASTSAAALVGLWQAGPALGRVGGRTAFRLLGLGGASLAALGYYEFRLLATDQVSIAVSPTTAVAAVFFLSSGLVLVSLAAIDGTTKFAALLSWLAVAAWSLAPTLSTLGGSPAAADHVELGLTLIAAITLLATGIVQELRAYRLQEDR